MSYENEQHQNYQPGGDGNDLVPVPEQSLIIPGDMLAQYTGGVDQTDQIALLPERITFDKDTGFWSVESMGDGLVEIEGQLVAATTIWARWTDRVGQPECIDVGKACSNLPHEMGLRIIFDDGVMGLFYWDAFGISFKAAQGAVRRAKVTGGHFKFDGRKQINTKFGSLYVPTLERIDEGA